MHNIRKYNAKRVVKLVYFK
ncbi:hypothetical protein [Citrobacter amalonaticus]